MNISLLLKSLERQHGNCMVGNDKTTGDTTYTEGIVKGFGDALRIVRMWVDSQGGAMSANLPPLPSTYRAWNTPNTCGGVIIEPLYTADQMRAYATAALSAQAAELEAMRADAERLQKAWDASFAQAIANGERSATQAAELQSLRDAIANDSLACTYQTLGQYRTMLLAAVDSLLRKD